MEWTAPLLADPSLLFGAALLVMLAAILCAIVVSRKLLTSVALTGLFTLVAALWYIAMDAPDVAFTEAVVGGGVSTLILLGSILLTRESAEPVSPSRMVFPAIAVILAGVAILYAVGSIPGFGDPASPANASVGRDYLERTYKEVGIPNVVSAVLASYRGFDTLGETTVVFAAAVGVMLLLGFGERALGDPARRHEALNPDLVEEIDHHVVLRVATKIMIPLMFLFGLYVLFHGEVGAGGGFQAGVILAIALIVHALVFGLSETMRAFPAAAMRAGASAGVLIYAGVGVINMLNGGAFLDYDFLFPPPLEQALSGPDGHAGQHYGIIAIEIGVTATVASGITAIFYGFAGRAPDIASRGASRGPESGGGS
ncbi:DUF4040 domain-containing protein [bacterium]|nr:DUF4040 domain-containing protein [bacterium]